MIQAFGNRDRDKLLELSKSLFTVLKNENSYFSSVGWILPDNHVFLRVHDPKIFGDNVSKVRPDVAAVNKKRRQHSGFDAGYLSMQYRIVQPVFLHDQYLGALQFGIKASIIFEALQNKLNTIAGMAVLNEESSVVQGSKIPKLKSRTHTIRSRDVALFNPIQDQLDWNREQQSVELNGRTHVILNVLPLSNFQNEKLGVFFVALDISEELAQKRKLLITVSLISSILLSFSLLILYFSYGSLIQKIINLNQSLEKNNLELENRVHERTAKLQESEKWLQKSELRFRSLVESSCDWIWEVNENGVYTYASPQVENILGYKPEEVVGKTMFDLMPPEEAERISALFKESSEKAEPIITLMNEVLHKEGQRIFLETSGVPFFDETGKVAGYRGVDRDITDRKKAEKQKEKLTAQLHQIKKMESIGLMAGGVAHDLNNILSGIVGYPDLILQDLPKDSKLRKPIEAIQDSGKRAATVVADLLTITKGAASTRETHDLNSLIQEYLDSPECKKLKSLYPLMTLQFQIEDTQLNILCSPVHVKKCLMNLVTNASESIVDDGTVVVFTHHQYIDDAASAEHNMKVGEYVVLGVKDTGPGISNENLNHIFEPFYTKKTIGRSGTGLGLTVVWNTMEDHNGRVFVESDDNGTCFQLYFPVSKGEESFQPENDKTVTLSGNGEHILVVDDEPYLRDIASQMLRSFGYMVDSVCSGELAVKFVKENPVDLIVIDMLMNPGMNGHQTYKEILKLYPYQKAIITSGFSESADVKATLQLGAGGFIKKPYSKDQLGIAVKKALNS